MKVVPTRFTAVLLGLVILASACSSTEKKSAQTQSQDPSSEATTAGGAPGDKSGSSAGAGNTTGGRRSSSAVTGSGSAQTTASAAARRPLPKAAPITLGVLVRSGNPGAAFGIAAGAEDDQAIVNQAKALAAEINARGGMAGHKISLAVRQVDQTDQSTATQSRLQNEACTDLTEDVKVFAVISIVDNGNLGYACYAKHGTPIAPHFPLADDSELRPVQPWVLPPMEPTSTRVAQFYPVALGAFGYMTKTMGVLANDTPGSRNAVEKLLIPAIAQRGGKVIDKQYLPLTYDGHAQGTAAAVLRFNSKNIDRVVIFQANAGWFLFTKQAEQQRYRPRYGITSFETPQGYIELPGARIPPEQLRGTVGASYDPGADVTERVYPATANEKRCWNIVNKRGGFNIKTRSEGIGANMLCDLFFMMQDALAPATGKSLARVHVPGLVRALGIWRGAVPVPQYKFGPRLDAAAVYRRMAYNDQCDCFKYTSPWIDIR